MTLFVDEPRALAAVIARASAAERLGLDAEGNGMHAYRSRLCTLQLAWREGSVTETAVVDTLALDLGPLAELLGPGGPLKVLHDLTFDARMLADRDLVLGNVHDTSVMARFLDEKATGLSSLSEAHLGVTLSKALQHHDWSVRPLGDAELAYLAGDVMHLLDLADVLDRRVAELGIAEEVALETGYKLATSLAPSSAPPDYTRAKGYGDLAPAEQAVLRRLFAARDGLAERADVPAHKIAPTAVLVEIARRRPRRHAEIRRLCRGRTLRYLPDFMAAVESGLADGAPPAEEQPSTETPSREEITRRRDLERKLSAWRKAEAARRGVSMQVVLPGHCVGPLVSALLGPEPEASLSAVPGLGQTRIDRYVADWLAIA